MSPVLDRQFFSQVVIVLAMCIGGWMMFVEPRAQELADLDAVVEQGESAADTQAPDEAQMMKLLQRVKAIENRVDEIKEAGEYALNTSALYGRLTAAARAEQIELTNLVPGERRASASDKRVQVIPLTMTLRGEYEPVARFLDQISDIGGFIRPRGINIAPLRADGREQVLVRFTCEALAFDMPEALHAMEGGADAES